MVRDELSPDDYQRLKDAAVRQAHRLRNQALSRAPADLCALAARVVVRLRAVLRPVRRESAAPPGG